MIDPDLEEHDVEVEEAPTEASFLDLLGVGHSFDGNLHFKSIDYGDGFQILYGPSTALAPLMPLWFSAILAVFLVMGIAVFVGMLYRVSFGYPEQAVHLPRFVKRIRKQQQLNWNKEEDSVLKGRGKSIPQSLFPAEVEEPTDMMDRPPSVSIRTPEITTLIK